MWYLWLDCAVAVVGACEGRGSNSSSGSGEMTSEQQLAALALFAVFLQSAPYPTTRAQLVAHLQADHRAAPSAHCRPGRSVGCADDGRPFRQADERAHPGAHGEADVHANPGADGEVCLQKPGSGEATRLDCASGFGAATFLTGTFGFVAASKVLERLAKKAKGRLLVCSLVHERTPEDRGTPVAFRAVLWRLPQP